MTFVLKRVPGVEVDADMVLACQLSLLEVDASQIDADAETFTVRVGPQPTFGRWQIVSVTEEEIAVQVTHRTWKTGFAFLPDVEDVPLDEAVVEVEAALAPVGSFAHLSVLRFEDR